MFRSLVIGIVALLAAGSARANAPVPSAPLDVLVQDVTVIDVIDGDRLAHRDIGIRDGRIVSIEAHVADAKAAARMIDGAGRYAIPGLWDMHVHFGGGEALIEENRQLLPLYVAHGITAVRDAAGDLSPSVFAWRDAVARGEQSGPRIFTSGPKIEGVGSIWPGDLEVADEAQLDAAFAQLRDWTVDFIKLTDDKLSPELFLLGLAKAKAFGLKTSAHIPLAVPVATASAAGLGSIEHMAYALKAGVQDDVALSARFAAGEMTAAELWTAVHAAFSPEATMAPYRALAANGTAVTPTLNGSRITAYLDQDDHADDPYLQYIGPGLRKTYAWRIERAAKDDAAAVALRHERFERIAGILPLLQAAGVTILAGTDAGFLNSFNYPGIGLHDEMALFVRYGLTPLQTLQAATINGARFLGKDARHGSIAVGKVADIVLLRGDPLDDIAATRAIDAVVLRGEVHDRGALDAMLDAVRASVQNAEAASQP